MTSYEQRQQHREIYNQLRLQLAFPGDVVAEIRRPFQPVNRDDWTWEDAMRADTPSSVRATPGKLLLLTLGRFGQAVA